MAAEEDAAAVKAMCQQVAPAFFSAATLPLVEIEFRLGMVSPSGFNADVGREAHDSALKALRAFSGWESVQHAVDHVRRLPRGVRVIVSADDSCTPPVVQRKSKCVAIDMETLPGLAVRFAVAQEEPVGFEALRAMDPAWEEHGVVVARDRWSFQRKKVRIDVTQVTLPSDVAEYQVELEVLGPESITDDAQLMHVLHKVVDVQRAAGLAGHPPKKRLEV